MRGKACTLFWNVNAWFEDHFLKPPSQSCFENPKSVLQRLKIFWYLKGFSHAACYVNIFGILLFSSPLIFMYFPWPSSLSLWHGMVHWWQLSFCYQYNGNKVSWVQISSQADWFFTACSTCWKGSAALPWLLAQNITSQASSYDLSALLTAYLEFSVLLHAFHGDCF